MMFFQAVGVIFENTDGVHRNIDEVHKNIEDMPNTINDTQTNFNGLPNTITNNVTPNAINSKKNTITNSSISKNIEDIPNTINGIRTNIDSMQKTITNNDIPNAMSNSSMSKNIKNMPKTASNIPTTTNSVSINANKLASKILEFINFTYLLSKVYYYMMTLLGAFLNPLFSSTGTCDHTSLPLLHRIFPNKSETFYNRTDFIVTVIVGSILGYVVMEPSTTFTAIAGGFGWSTIMEKLTQGKINKK
jgi:uncharacterized protein YoxC